MDDDTHSDNDVTKCTCKHFYLNLSDYTDSSSEDSTYENVGFDRKYYFISIFNNSHFKNDIIISNYLELENYRKEYSHLSTKDIKNVNEIWGRIKVYSPVKGFATLRSFENKTKIIKSNQKIAFGHFSNTNIGNTNCEESELKTLPVKKKEIKSINGNEKENCKKKENLTTKLLVTNEMNIEMNDFKFTEPGIDYTSTLKTKNIKKNTVDQSVKKKLKKQKQKEKKSIKRDTSNSSRDLSENSDKMPAKKHRNLINKVDMKHSDNKIVNNDSDIICDSDDVEFLSDCDNIEENFNTTQILDTTSLKDVEQAKCVEIENEEEFVINYRRRKTMHNKSKYKNFSSEKLGEEAIQLILDNNYTLGLEYLAESVCKNPSDHRHYLNRCYCNLISNKPTLALTDAQYVIQRSTNEHHLFIANLRAGQALIALKKFQQAEIYLNVAVNLCPANAHAQRELMHAKIEHLVSMGFSETAVINALQIHASITEVINYLIENISNSDSSKLKNDFDTFNTDYNDFVFSSDEDEEQDSVKILNRILNYTPEKAKLNHITSKPLITSSSTKTTTDAKKKTAAKTIIANSNGFNEKSIWVGNLIETITTAMLKRNFKKYGNITSIYRPDTAKWAFINFEKKSEVTKVLNSTTCHEINGRKLQVQLANKQK